MCMHINICMCLCACLYVLLVFTHVYIFKFVRVLYLFTLFMFYLCTHLFMSGIVATYALPEVFTIQISMCKERRRDCRAIFKSIF
jgi:hypothetical protein